MTPTPRQTLLGLLLAGGLALPSWGATAPSQMMANVYRIAEAGAVLQICFESATFKSLPGEKSARLEEYSARLGALVHAIAKRYDDDSLAPTYVATRARIAADSGLRLHVKNNYQYCGERLQTSMEAYVVENEALINDFLRKEALRPPPKPQ